MNSTSSCPYAATIASQTDSTKGKAIPRNASSEALDAIELAKKSCPAFRKNENKTLSCPFRLAKNADDLKQTMMNVPKSHFEKDGNGSSIDIPKSFSLALEHMHNVSVALHQTEGNENKDFIIKGGCPFKSYYDPKLQESVPFISAMEKFSLTAIMADMASEGVERESEQHAKEEEKKEESLSKALKVGTAQSHKAAENVHFVKKFIKNEIRLDLYKELIVGLYFVYKELEIELDRYGPINFPSLHQPQKLARTDALERDLSFFFGENWKSTIQPSTAVRDYVNRIKEIASSKPVLLLSHAYTRYLGDLSGGRVLARIAKRALNLSGNKGLAFYEFQNITNAKKFKDFYRYQLDQLTLSHAEIHAMVKEANVAFVLNMRVFEELDVLSGEVPGAQVRSLEVALKFGDNIEYDTAGMKECPFLTQSKQTKHTPAQKGKRCPWPFIFMHDPKQGMRDYQTWIVIGIFFCVIYKMFKQLLLV